MKRWICVVMLCAACGNGGNEDENGTQCAAGEVENPVSGVCEEVGDMNPTTTDTGDDEDPEDMGADPVDMPANDPDIGVAPDMNTMPPDMDEMMPDMPMMPGTWPPAIESLHSPGICNLPACDEGGDAGIDTTGTWVMTLTTVESDCSDFIIMQDPRAEVGNVDVSDPEPLLGYTGECGVNGMMAHITTAKMGIAATCEQSEAQFGVVPFQTSIVEYNGGTGTGQAFVYLENVPAAIGGDCFMRFDVLQERQ